MRGAAIILVVCGLVARLVLPLSHAHDYQPSTNPVEHAAIPHIHVGGETHAHPHGSEAHADHSHHSNGGEHESADDFLSIKAPNGDHDQDVIWLPSAGGEGMLVKGKTSLSEQTVVAAYSVPLWSTGRLEMREQVIAQNVRAGGSKIFILLRTLRI